MALMNIPRSIKNSMRTIKKYCDAHSCANCDVCYLLHNTSPFRWDIELLDLETSCEYEKSCSSLVLARTNLEQALFEKNKLIADNEVLKVTNTVLKNYLDRKVPNWRVELGEE